MGRLIWTSSVPCDLRNSRVAFQVSRASRESSLTLYSAGMPMRTGVFAASFRSWVMRLKVRSRVAGEMLVGSLGSQ